MLEISSHITPGKLPKYEFKARERAKDAVRRLRNQLSHGGVVDEFLADQVVIFMALAASGANPPIAIDRRIPDAKEQAKNQRRCEVLVGNVSSHTKTAMKIAETMLGNITFKTEKIEGVGKVMVCEKTA